MKSGLLQGHEEHVRYQVKPELTVPHILGGTRGPSLLETSGEPVLASGFLVALIENTCWQATVPFVEDDESIVGRLFELDHTSPAVAGDDLDIAVTCRQVTELSSHTYDVVWRTVATSQRTDRAVGVMQHHLYVLPRTRVHQKLARAFSTA